MRWKKINQLNCLGKWKVSFYSWHFDEQADFQFYISFQKKGDKIFHRRTHQQLVNFSFAART